MGKIREIRGFLLFLLTSCAAPAACRAGFLPVRAPVHPKTSRVGNSRRRAGQAKATLPAVADFLVESQLPRALERARTGSRQVRFQVEARYQVQGKAPFSVPDLQNRYGIAPCPCCNFDCPQATNMSGGGKIHVSGTEAKEALYREVVAANQRRILAIARSFAGDYECQDLCQEILLQMWRGLDNFQGRCAPSTWVYRVALNTAITFRRRNGRRPVIYARPAAEPHPEPVAPGDPGNEILILEEFLRSLAEIDRAVFLLYLEDLTYCEIAEITGLSKSHVGVCINRLKKIFTQRYCGG